jgi:hypothetical protein
LFSNRDIDVFDNSIGFILTDDKTSNKYLPNIKKEEKIEVDFDKTSDKGIRTNRVYKDMNDFINEKKIRNILY